MLALMKKEEELLYTRKKNNGRHLSVQGTEKHMTLNIKTYDPMVLCDHVLAFGGILRKIEINN